MFESHRLPTDSDGFCDLAKFVMDESLFTTYSAEEHERVYESLGWAKRLETIDCSFEIVLDSGTLQKAMPTKTTFALLDRTYQLEEMNISNVGGQRFLSVYPKGENLQKLRAISVTLLDATTKDGLTEGGSYGIETDQDGTEYVAYTIPIKPISGSLPVTILIVPHAYHPEWDMEADAYDPKASPNPVNGTYWKYDMDNAVEVQLQ